MKTHMIRMLLILCAGFGICGSVSAQDPPAPNSELAGPSPDFSPSGHFRGPINIPHIVRFRDLPMRMDFEPEIAPPVIIQRLNPQYVPLCERALREATDQEILEVAALQLYRISLRKLADISPAAETLQNVAKSTESRTVRSACVQALAVGDIQAAAPLLVEFAATATESERMVVEGALAKWKSEEARALWRARIQDSFATAGSIQLAFQGLTALGDAESSARCLQVVEDSTADYLKRRSAADAAAVLAPTECVPLAGRLANGVDTERLLAVALCNSGNEGAMQHAVTLCSDAADAVASAAWKVVYQQKPELLQDLLPTGRTHRDAHVRMVAARVMRAFPNAERSTWLNQLLSDIHIEVRNVARQMLAEVAESQPDLKPQIISEAVGKLVPESPDWQGIEQSLVLLGQLRSTEYSTQCVPLLAYPRNEVMVSAAWLIHLYPDIAVRDQVLQTAIEAETLIRDQTLIRVEHGLKQTFLTQYLGIMRVREIEETLRTMFSKSVPGPHARRGAAMWALGLLYENNPNPELIGMFIERIKDRNSPNPEQPVVRRLCLIALGMMRATSAQDAVVEAFNVDPERIRASARWVHPLVGLALPPPIPPIRVAVGGWRLNPLEE